jgi:hypothetical protein
MHFLEQAAVFLVLAVLALSFGLSWQVGSSTTGAGSSR